MEPHGVCALRLASHQHRALGTPQLPGIGSLLPMEPRPPRADVTHSSAEGQRLFCPGLGNDDHSLCHVPHRCQYQHACSCLGHVLGQLPASGGESALMLPAAAVIFEEPTCPPPPFITPYPTSPGCSGLMSRRVGPCHGWKPRFPCGGGRGPPVSPGAVSVRAPGCLPLILRVQRFSLLSSASS